jgi:molybdopterin/thiamine biosynthesis adenylyltransferase
VTAAVPLLPDPQAFFAAEPALDLADAAVAVAGCGSVGGLAAGGLAGAGVGRLVLLDRDRLEGANLRRHVCGRADLGRPKAHAVADFLAARFPDQSSEPHELCVLDRPDEARRLLAGCAAVLVAVDAEGPKHLLDGMARQLSRPAVFAGVYGSGWAGELILSDAAAGTPCYACAARSLGRAGVLVEPPTALSPYTQPAPGRPEANWPRADLTGIGPVALLAARLIVAILAGQRGLGALRAELTAGESSAWRLSLRKVPGWGGPWALASAEVRRMDGCPVCGPQADAGKLSALLDAPGVKNRT